MIPEIERRPIPKWLAHLNSVDILPIRDLLADSLYYPSAALDGDPVKYLAGFIHSFIYVDYGAFKHNEVLQTMQDDCRGFRGYRLAYWRDVEEKELTPNGWRPSFPDYKDGGRYRPRKEEYFNDMQPTFPYYWDNIDKLDYIVRQLKRLFPPYADVDWQDRRPTNYNQEHFAIWGIYQRKEKFTDKHGPERFSFLYICDEGAATYHRLYYGNECAPDVVAIIRSDGCGASNWTSFRNPSNIFGWLVFNNPYGKPRFFLCDSQRQNLRDSSYWSEEYKDLVCLINNELGLWEKRHINSK